MHTKSLKTMKYSARMILLSLQIFDKQSGVYNARRGACFFIYFLSVCDALRSKTYLDNAISLNCFSLKMCRYEINFSCNRKHGRAFSLRSAHPETLIPCSGPPCQKVICCTYTSKHEKHLIAICGCILGRRNWCAQP